jgi:hypothetical protein
MAVRLNAHLEMNSVAPNSTPNPSTDNLLTRTWLDGLTKDLEPADCEDGSDNGGEAGSCDEEQNSIRLS